MKTVISDNLSIQSPIPISSFSFLALNYFMATEDKASFGHLSNQSIVQQLMIEGNCLHLFLNLSPTGLNVSTMCRFYLVFWTKSFIKFSLVSMIFVFSLEANILISERIYS